jgi:hypothetical protein
MGYVGERDHYDKSKRKRLRTMGPDEMHRHHTERNAHSIDQLPAVPGTAARTPDTSTGA